MEFVPDEALDEALSVFWEKGFEGTSMRDLLDATDLSKSSVYQTFGSKAELFELCLDRYANRVATEMRLKFEQSPNARKFFEALFLGLAGQATESGARGCFLMNSVTEFGTEPVAFQPALQRGMRLFYGVFLDAVETGLQEGSISCTKHPRDVADFLLGSMAGLMTLGKSGISGKRARGMANLVLESLN